MKSKANYGFDQNRFVFGLKATSLNHSLNATTLTLDFVLWKEIGWLS